ncbi:MAG: hypothetical protein M9944_13245 [Rhizobiaceae bacterium]|nr:hypothetical protein [Rhizobiaceae bacterium]
MTRHYNPATMNRAGIRGYSDKPSAAPGEIMTFHVSADTEGSMRADVVRLIHGDTSPSGPGFREEVVDCVVNGEYPVRRERTQIGSYVAVPDPKGLCAGRSLTVHCFVQVTTGADKRQGLVSRWSEQQKAGWAIYVESGYVHFVVGDGSGKTDVIRSQRRLFPGIWYSVSAVLDGNQGYIGLWQKVALNRVNSRFGPVVPLDTNFSGTSPSQIVPSAASPTIVIGGLAEDQASDTLWVNACFNGKLDSPTIYSRALTAGERAALAKGDRSGGPVAAWDFSVGIGPSGIGTDHVADLSPHGLHGQCVNQPERACTGWNWDGTEEHFIHAPQQYGAIAFNEDALDDCRWPVSVTLTVPDSLTSGCYALRVIQGDNVDHIPFFVLPPRGTATAKILLLIPTASYAAYANWQIVPALPSRQGASGRPYVLHDFDVEMNVNFQDYGLSVYETHVDGRSTKYTSWRRPISNMRPMSRHREFGGPWGFSADLHLVDWLHAKNFQFDVATDHDLHVEGVNLLKRYKVVVTGSHPEYYSGEMIDAWEDYLADGGRGMYLGGNGMYWVVSFHPEKPWVMEVRKGESGTTRVQATPGEFHHSTSGERGGLWRHRARASQKVWGVGISAFGFDSSTYFVQMKDASATEASWIMAGISPEEKIGDFGLTGGGAAGFEVDMYDLAIGTPPHTLLIASSFEHTRNYQLATEELRVSRSGMNGEEHPDVRGDITFFHTANNGGMFASSSITWCASLSWNGYDNNVSKMTENVLSAFETMDVLPS